MGASELRIGAAPGRGELAGDLDREYLAFIARSVDLDVLLDTAFDQARAAR